MKQRRSTTGRWLGRLLGPLWRSGEHRTVTSEIDELYAVLRERHGQPWARRWRRRQMRRYLVQSCLERIRSLPSPSEIMSNLGRDLLHSARRLARAPAFTGTILATLALGIGATTAVFNVVDSVLLQPIAFPEPERLVGLWHRWPGQWSGDANMSPALYFTYREQGRAFEEIGMWDPAAVSITGLQEPEQVEAIIVTDGTFRALRVMPQIGRLFTSDDDAPDAPRTVILSDAYWRERFGADPGVLGTTLTINGRPSEVIGVTRPGLHFLNHDPAIYIPFQWDRADLFIGNFSFQALGRLKAGVTLEEANADVDRMIPLATEMFRGIDLETLREGGFSANVRPLRVDVVGDIGDVLWVLLGTMALVLAIACANVANLMLVRAEGQHGEVALRAALGASRRRLAGSSLLESVVMAVAGGAFGVALAQGGIRLLLAMTPNRFPRQDEIALDPGVALFALAISLGAGLLFGGLTIARHRDSDFAQALREGGRGGAAGRARQRARNTLVVAQVALALVLMVGSGLMVRSFIAMRDVEPGFTDPDTALTFRLSIPGSAVPDVRQAIRQHEEIMRRVGAIAGVERVALTSSATMDGWDSNDTTEVEGFPAPDNLLAPSRRYKWISPEYFETMGNPLLAGRAFTWAEIHDRAPVAVITEDMALEYWGSPVEALGKRLSENLRSPWRTIVGVVGNVHDDGVDRDTVPTVYWPLLQDDFWSNEQFGRRALVYVVRSPRVGSPGFIDEVRRAVWSRNPDLPFADVQTLREVLSDSMARTSFTLMMLGIAAGAALLLAAVGIYGVISYVVTHRTREIGVRMALGARHEDVSRLVMGQGLLLAAVGTALGLAAAAATTRLMDALLFGVGAVDAPTYLAGAAAIVALALLASYLPARRAAGVDPMEALRWE